MSDDCVVFASAVHPDTNNSVVFEDDGRTGYAYWLSRERVIVNDVWLYNRSPAPEFLDPQTDGTAPRNSNQLVDAKEAARVRFPQSPDDITFGWMSDVEVHIFLRGRLLGILSKENKLGMALLAKLEGPLAKPLRMT